MTTRAIRAIAGWAKEAADRFGVSLMTVDIPRELREAIVRAQSRRVMVNAVDVADDLTGLTRTASGFCVRLDDEHDVDARAVIIASGAHYRRLDVPGLADREAKIVSDRNAVVVGGPNSAG